MLEYCIVIIIGYFSGNILFGYHIPKLLKQIDIYGVSRDGNPGTYNAFVYGGFFCGIITLMGDLLKGFIPVFISRKFVNMELIMFALVMLAPVVGHAFPLRGEGGKSIAVSFGVLLGIFPEIRPLILLIILYILFSVVIRVKEHNKRSIITFACFAFACIFLIKDIPVLAGSIMISAVVIYKIIISQNRLRDEAFAHE